MEAILFDWDGTLADSLGAIYAANVEVMAALGLPFDRDLYRRHFAPDWRVMYARLGVPAARLEEANARWWAALDAAETALFPGVRDALERLAATGLPLGIVTAGRSDRVGAELRRHGIDGLFGAVVYGDDDALQKPDPAPLRGRRSPGSAGTPTGSVYVGDTPDDMRMAVARRRPGGRDRDRPRGRRPSCAPRAADETASTTVELGRDPARRDRPRGDRRAAALSPGRCAP